MAIETISQGRVEWRARHIPGLIRVKMPPGGEREIARTIALLPGVRYAHEDFLGHLDQTTPPCGVVPNDTYFTQQWGLRNTGQTVNGITGTYGADARAVEGWEALTDAPDVIIAVLDSGVNYDHADLAANIWTNPGEIPGNNIDDDNNGVVDDVHGAAFDEITGDFDCEQAGRTPDGDPWDALSSSYPTKIATEGGGHGTGVMSVAGADGNNSLQICGVVHSGKIMPIRATSCVGGVVSSWAIKGLDYAIGNGARIVNCSWGVVPSPALEDAFKSTDTNDVLVVATAGNSALDLDLVPSSYHQYPALYNMKNIIVVGASTQLDARFPPSNVGLTTVDLFAPGQNIRVLDQSVLTNYTSGTSFAAPMVAGAAALCFQAQIVSSSSDMVNRLKSTARPVSAVSGLCVSGGVLDINALLNAPCY